MLLHPTQPSSLANHDYHPQHAPFSARNTPRAFTLDRLPLSAHSQHHLPLHNSPLEPTSSYSYVPRGHPVHNSPSPDTMYQQHSLHSHLYEDHQNTPPNPTFDLQPRQHPPTIHTDNLLYPADSGAYSPSPLSSPADNPISAHSSARQFSFPQPMSAPHSQNAFPPRFPNDPGLSRFPFSNPTLDRRMSEPVLGAGRQSYPQPPPAHHDTFAYTATSSTTLVQPSPLSPRPSSSYSSYGNYQDHQRDGSAASLGSSALPDPYVAAAWSSTLKHPELESEPPIASSPLSPLYAASAASGSDVSATGLPSPPTHSRPSPSKLPASIPGARPPQPPQSSATATPRPGGNNSKTYSFVSLPGNAVKKRPRRRYDEIERLYQCSWPNCSKAYGTLNHLNAHVTMQRHGPKRSPNEFKELRKKWRQEKKEAEEQEREREREAHAQAIAIREMQQFAHHAPMAEYDHHGFVRRRMSMVEPYPDPHAHPGPHSLPNHSFMHGALQRQAPGHGQAQSFAGQPQSAPSYGSLPGPGIGIEARYGLPSPADEVQQFRYSGQAAHHPAQGLPSLSMPHHAPEEDMYYRHGQALHQQQQQQQQQSELVGPGWGNPHAPQNAAQQQGMRPPPPHQQQPFYGPAGSLTLPPPHSMSALSASAPNPSPLSGAGAAFTPLGPSTGPGPALGGPADVSMGITGARGADSGSPTPELAAHVSLGSNRLPPDSTLLTPLPGYEPEGEQLELGGRPRERERGSESDREREYLRERDERERVWGERGRERDRYYAGNGQGGNGREQQYE